MPNALLNLQYPVNHSDALLCRANPRGAIFMNESFSPSLALTIAAITFLTSCGGGSSSNQGENAGTTPTSNTAAVNNGASSGQESDISTKVADCFQLTPGVKYSLSNGIHVEIELGQFEGQTAYKSKDTEPGTSFLRESFAVVTASYIEELGGNIYDANGVQKGKYVFSGERIPFSVIPGQSIIVAGTNTTTYFNPPETNYASGKLKKTFLGFEDVTLGGRLFKDTCKFKTEPGEPLAANEIANPSTDWYAKGFGSIRFDYLNEDQVTERTELVTVIAAP